jgi:hypothetical protein
MLSLTDHKAAKLANVNIRAEKDGDDPVLAIDLALQIDLAAERVDDIVPGLHAFLYDGAAVPAQGQIPGTERATELRFPSLGPLTLDKDLPGFALTVAMEHGIGDPTSVDLEDVELGKFKIAAKTGGTVLLTCRAQARPNEEQLATLATMLEQAVTLTLTPPAAAEPDLVPGAA